MQCAATQDPTTKSSSAVPETKSHLPQPSHQHTELTSQSGLPCTCDNIPIWQLLIETRRGIVSFRLRTSVHSDGQNYMATFVSCERCTSEHVCSRSIVFAWFCELAVAEFQPYVSNFISSFPCSAGLCLDQLSDISSSATSTELFLLSSTFPAAVQVIQTRPARCRQAIYTRIYT
jgi:hypothetical protein